MKIGVSIIPTARSTDIAVLAKRAEELGFDSIWVPEQHTLPVRTERSVPRLWGDIVDPLVALARASSVTTTIKLGTAVLVVPARNPITLAKEVATLDMYSGGRLLFGIGVGSLPEEADVLGVDFEHRWTQAKHAVAAMKTLWTEDESEYYGEYYSFPPIYCYPKPATRPHPPIILGGKAPNVFKRIVAWGDGWVPIDVSVAQVAEARAELNRLCDLTGRDPSSIEISVMAVPPDRESIERYTNAGADRVILGLESAVDDQDLPEMERLAEAIL